MVGGKIQPGETAWAAALREVHEETGYAAARAWAVPSVNAFYEWQADRLNLIPAFAVEASADPVLNHEHEAYEWLAAPVAVGRLAWPEQQRLLTLVDHLLRASAVLPDWYIPCPAP